MSNQLSTPCSSNISFTWSQMSADKLGRTTLTFSNSSSVCSFTHYRYTQLNGAMAQEIDCASGTFTVGSSPAIIQSLSTQLWIWGLWGLVLHWKRGSSSSHKPISIHSLQLINASNCPPYFKKRLPQSPTQSANPENCILLGDMMHWALWNLAWKNTSHVHYRVPNFTLNGDTGCTQEPHNWSNLQVSGLVGVTWLVSRNNKLWHCVIICWIWEENRLGLSSTCNIQKCYIMLAEMVDLAALKNLFVCCTRFIALPLWQG